jgi:protein-S-isoprenylcysteine O-methyltransferase Ste14
MNLFSVFRHILAILLLPFMVVVVIPWALESALAEFDSRWVDWAWLARLGGAILILAGLGLFAWCTDLLARIGRGTLAPWAPTAGLVSNGPYRYMRNPMISGVAAILIGEAMWWGSWVLGAWALLFLVINHVYFIYSEEPGLEKRFGEGYRAYKAKVPRWLPRFTPSSGHDD